MTKTVPALTTAHLQDTTKVLAQAKRAVHRESAKRRSAMEQLIIFTALFFAVLAIETTMAAMMFALLEVEILGHMVSGAAFGLLVPIVIGAAHVRKHVDGDWLTSRWMSGLASLGILLFLVGLSSMVGFSAWQAGQDALNDFATGPTGMLGGQNLFDPNVQAGGDGDAGLGWLPNAMLFVGLSFGMIISVYFASFCLGRVLTCWAVLAVPAVPRKAALEKIKEIQGQIKALHRMIAADMVARAGLPKDPKQRFAREVGHLCQAVASRHRSTSSNFTIFRTSSTSWRPARNSNVSGFWGWNFS
ncbi:MAG: hypothetical protein AAFR27_03760 [Pseudomonadota bacterium]